MPDFPRTELTKEGPARHASRRAFLCIRVLCVRGCSVQLRKRRLLLCNCSPHLRMPSALAFAFLWRDARRGFEVKNRDLFHRKRRPRKAAVRRVRKRKNRTLLQALRGAHFYVSLTINLSPAPTQKGFRGKTRGLLATEIGSGATGILGVFPICTSRRRWMYI